MPPDVSPPNERRPAPPQNRPISNATNGYTEFTRQLGLQRHEPLTTEDRADLNLLIEAAERGFRLAVRCGQWLVARKSVAAHMGPVCAAKAVI